jgi:hypothetical protein
VLTLNDRPAALAAAIKPTVAVPVTIRVDANAPRSDTEVRLSRRPARDKRRDGQSRRSGDDHALY